jgi:hypothetical protein
MKQVVDDRQIHSLDLQVVQTQYELSASQDEKWNWVVALIVVSRIVHYMLWMAKFKICEHCEYFCVFNELLPHEKNIYQWNKDFRGKGAAIPLQAWTCPEGSRRLRLPDCRTIGT